MSDSAALVPADKVFSKSLLDLSLDVFICVLETLDVKSLYRMSLVCKRIHRFLASDDLERVWTLALEDAGFGFELERPMKPLQLARLIESDHCYDCMRRGAVRDW